MIKDPVQLVDYVEKVAPVGSELGIEDIERIWCSLVPDSVRDNGRGLRTFEAAIRESTELSGHLAELEWRPGGWRVRVSSGATKSIISAALIAGIMAVAGLPGLASAVVTAVVPLLFEVERVTLSSKETEIAANLVLKPGIKRGDRTVDELYSVLPADVRDQINRLDFADLVQKLREAGVADEVAPGRFTVSNPTVAKFRVTVQ